MATLVVKKRVAACVNIIPHIRSLFWWNGRPEKAREALLILKTTQSCFNTLKSVIAAAHPYDVPEILGVTVEHGHEPYLAWVRSSVVAGGHKDYASSP